MTLLSLAQTDRRKTSLATKRLARGSVYALANTAATVTRSDHDDVVQLALNFFVGLVESEEILHGAARVTLFLSQLLLLCLETATTVAVKACGERLAGHL